MFGTLVTLFACWVVVASCVSLDSLYHQDVSHRAVFKGNQQVTQWESLPFDGLATTSSMVYVASSDCFVSQSSETLYSSVRNTQQNKLSLESPYTAWQAVGSVAGNSLLASSSPGISLFALSDNNILAVEVTSPGCDAVVSSRAVLSSNYSWGTVLAATSSTSHVWMSTTSAGLLMVDIEQGLVQEVSLSGVDGDEAITSLHYVSRWNKLFAGTKAAFYAVDFDGKSLGAVRHEWIGGVIDAEVLSMSYDAVNNALWVAEPNSVHKLLSTGVWLRYGQRQGSPFANITWVSAVNGFVYVGSVYGLARVRGDANPVQKYKATWQQAASGRESAQAVVEPANDPWSWLYYAGPRYLPDDKVRFMVAGKQDGAQSASNVVVVIGATGIALLESSLWTLAEKSQSVESAQYRHVREGLTTGVSLTVYGNVNTYQQGCDDNDGLWTSMHAMGEVYRYLNTKAPDARDAAWKAFEGLEMLSILPGDYPHFPARSFCTVADNANNRGGCTGDAWKPSPVNSNYMWKSTTSSDEIAGHLAIYPLIYDHIAVSANERQRAYDLIEGITGGILANDLYLIDPSTGKPTHWGFWNPALVNDDPDHYSERGTNSVEILAFCASAYSVTHDTKYKDTFWDLAVQHGYIYSAMNGKLDNPVEDNHSDNELLFQAYHTLLYALQRLSPKDASLASIRADVQQMVSALVPSLERTWSVVQGELSPLWLGIYAGTGGLPVDDVAVDHATWTLRHSAIDFIEWPTTNENRWDVTLSPFFARDSTDPLFRQILPPQERVTQKWNSDPFRATATGSGYGEEAPYIWQLPYHLMLYNGLIQ